MGGGSHSTARNEPPPQILTALRQATGQTHKEVEKLTPFFRADFNRPLFLKWLDLMHGFYRQIDRTVGQSSFSSTCGWHYAARCPLIERDLAALAGRAPEDSADPSRILAKLQSLGNTGEIAGMLYVVEGSTLGGNVLLGVLGKRAGVTAASGASFFAPHGENPQPCWAEYVQLLSRLSSEPGTEHDVVHGAKTTFTTLQEWIKETWRH